jgi:hypothetical protein
MIGGLVKVAGELSHDPGVGVDRAGREVAQPEIFLHALVSLSCFCSKPIQWGNREVGTVLPEQKWATYFTALDYLFLYAPGLVIVRRQTCV